MDKRRRGAGLALALAALPLAGFGRCGSERGSLVWQDEFEGGAGAAPDAARWGFDVGTGENGWGNRELQHYRVENAVLDGAGHLAITARKEDFQGSAYTSARLTTRGKLERTRGRFEARIKLPAGQGLWPAFWMLGANVGEVGWPTCGEIDVLELRGQQPEIAIGSLHGPGYSGGQSLSDSYALTGARFDDDFHVFAVVWHEDFIAWEVDGETYQVITPDQLPAGTTWVFDKPFFLLLNLAVGGNFVGAPDATTVFPATMLVDWVRVYES